MNAPAKRFSLTRLLTSVPAEAKAEKPPVANKPPLPEKPVIPPIAALEPIGPDDATPAVSLLKPGGDEPRTQPSKDMPVASLAPARAKAVSKEAVDESHPKKKRSYSVDMKVCEELEILAWYQGKSSSSVVEELIRKHLSQNRSLLIKATDIWDAR